MLFLGFSAGLPILLIFGTLSVWLREAGVARSMVTVFSWAALGYSFKFVWAPLVDQLRVPILTKWLGRRRGWLLLSQLMLVLALWIMSSSDPALGRDSLFWIAIGAVLLGFSSATQDIVIDAFRIELAEPRMQGLLSATYIGGYRIAMILAGAGGLLFAEAFGSTVDTYDYIAWQSTYRLMALAMLVGIVTTLVIKEPRHEREVDFSTKQNMQLLTAFIFSVCVFIASFYFTAQIASPMKENLLALVHNKSLASVITESLRLSIALAAAWGMARISMRANIVSKRVVSVSYIDPIKDFFHRYGRSAAWLVLGVIGLYRISDIVLGVIANVFYYDLGFTKNQIAVVAKSFGLGMTILGGILGGVLAYRFGVMKILLLGAILSAGTNLLFMWMTDLGPHITMLYVVISADNLSAGLASAAFVAFLSALTNINFTAMQFAIFTSLMTLLPKILGGYSGSMVDQIGYSNFFIFTALLGLPVIALILLANRRLDIDS